MLHVKYEGSYCALVAVNASGEQWVLTVDEDRTDPKTLIPQNVGSQQVAEALNLLIDKHEADSVVYVCLEDWFLFAKRKGEAWEIHAVDGRTLNYRICFRHQHEIKEILYHCLVPGPISLIANASTAGWPKGVDPFA